jgi:hypothetical protein
MKDGALKTSAIRLYPKVYRDEYICVTQVMRKFIHVTFNPFSTVRSI